MGCRVSIHIDAPPDRVFDVASDFPGAPARCSGIVSVEMLTDGPVGKGTRFRETRTVMGRHATEEFEITRYQRPDSYDIHCASHGCTFDTTVSVDRIDSGGSRLTMDYRAKAVAFPAKVMNLFMGRAINNMCRKAMEQDLADIKASIEGHAVGIDRADGK